MRSRNTRSLRMVTVTLCAAAILTLALASMFVRNARGNVTTDPPFPSVPTHDPYIVASGEATKSALDAAEAAQQKSAAATAIAAEQLGLSNPKDPNNRTAPPPMAIETVQAQTLAKPANGIDIVQSPSSSWINRYHITNMWSGTVGGKVINIYVGSKADIQGQPSVWKYPEQGVLLYDSMGRGNAAEYLSLTRNGALKLTASNGSCLTMVSSDMTTFTFDVSALTWSCTP